MGYAYPLSSDPSRHKEPSIIASADTNNRRVTVSCLPRPRYILNSIFSLIPQVDQVFNRLSKLTQLKKLFFSPVFLFPLTKYLTSGVAKVHPMSSRHYRSNHPHHDVLATAGYSAGAYRSEKNHEPSSADPGCIRFARIIPATKIIIAANNARTVILTSFFMPYPPGMRIIK